MKLKKEINHSSTKLHKFKKNSQPDFCELRLPRLVSDGMVLQRAASVNIWGWAIPGEVVTVHFIGEEYSTTVLEDGTWNVLLPPLKAGGPYNMDIRSSKSIIIKDILIGDVWVCSGQSNMALPMVIRAINSLGKGGFIKDKLYQVTVGGQTIDLKGEWQYRVGAIVDPLPEPTFFQYQPLGLFNGMISPLLNYTIKGVIWYQGESNVTRTSDYQKLFSEMIFDWRKKWMLGNFPFLYVQLANYMEAKDQPCESDWAELRHAQLVSLTVSDTGMAVTIDVGEWNDLHPLNKKEVGSRLALLAQKVAYGDNEIVSSGPIYESMKVEDKKITISFSNVGSGLIIKAGSHLTHFAIAGVDHKFEWAKAVIEGDKVVVWNDQINTPVSVRYAWADNPEGANLYNKEGLPASPFRANL